LHSCHLKLWVRGRVLLFDSSNRRSQSTSTYPWRTTMKVSALTALLLAASTTLAVAGGDLNEKVMEDNPGVTGGGTTANPTAKPETGGLAEKAMKDAPGVSGGGTTANPTAKPDDKSLTGKAMKDHPAVGN
jgi:hypothetical protein